jgi:hypothetical protein
MAQYGTSRKPHRIMAGIDGRASVNQSHWKRLTRMCSFEDGWKPTGRGSARWSLWRRRNPQPPRTHRGSLRDRCLKTLPLGRVCGKSSFWTGGTSTSYQLCSLSEMYCQRLDIITFSRMTEFLSTCALTPSCRLSFEQLSRLLRSKQRGRVFLGPHRRHWGAIRYPSLNARHAS